MRIAPGSDIGSVVTRFNEVEELQSEVREHVASIQDLMARMVGAVNGTSTVGRSTERRGRKRGRPAGKVRAARKAKRSGGKRVPRGALKAAIHQVLGGGKALKPVAVVKALPQAGIAKPKYTSVYLALRNDKAIKKTANGFTLKRNGAKAAKPAKKA